MNACHSSYTTFANAHATDASDFSKIMEAALHASEEIVHDLDVVYPKQKRGSNASGRQRPAKISDWVYMDHVKKAFQEGKRILDLASFHILFQVQHHAHPPSPHNCAYDWTRACRMFLIGEKIWNHRMGEPQICLRLIVRGHAM